VITEYGIQTGGQKGHLLLSVEFRLEPTGNELGPLESSLG